MQPMRVRYSPKARAQLTDIFTYIAEQNPRAAARVVARIRGAAEWLADAEVIAILGIFHGAQDRSS